MKISKKTLLEYFYIALGTSLLSFSIITFWAPHNLITGGISGLAIIIFYYSETLGFQVPVPIWLSNLVLNIPLFIVGFKIIPRAYFFRSIFGYLMLTLTLFLFRYVPEVSSDLLMATIFGGVIAGVGIGLVFKSCATTGGTTLIAAIIHKWALPHVSMAKILFCVDSSIILAGFVMFGPMSTMYAVVTVFIVTKVTDAAIEGFTVSKAAFIISNQADAIAEGINSKLNRGVTELPSRGRYLKKDGTLLLCVVPAKEIVNLKQFVYSQDEKAFVIVTDVREVLGEGFKAGQDTI